MNLNIISEHFKKIRLKKHVSKAKEYKKSLLKDE
jgi:hypothetical protein